jgi:NADH:ubiquinone oxidoreductase subunit 6 (subunit J)
MALPNSRSIPDLLSDAVSQLTKLVGNEFALARAEISEKAQQVARAAVLVGAGAVLLLPALVLALLAVAAALKESGFSDSASYLLTAGGAVLVSAILILAGLKKLSGEGLKPGVTLDQIERDKSAVKEMVR